MAYSEVAVEPVVAALPVFAVTVLPVLPAAGITLTVAVPEQTLPVLFAALPVEPG